MSGPIEETTNRRATTRWSPRILVLAAGLILILAGILVYANSLKTPFIFDSFRHIVTDHSIRHPWPLSDVVRDTNRPIVKLTLAINYAFGQLNVFGYHVVNIVIHILASLTLFGIVRRTLLTDRLRQRYEQAALWLALAAALIWLVHPLQTQAVTYIIQRTESLMGLFYLLTLYCMIRCVQGNHPCRWSIAAVAACALGMGTKEVMVTAPLAVFLYDRTFAGRSFTDALRRRWPLYVALAATWIVLFAVVDAEQVMEQPSSSRLALERSHPLQYAFTQSSIIMHYLRLSIWPHPLVLDYWWPVAKPSWKTVLMAIVITGLVFTALRMLWHRRPLGFLLTCFFLVLAPTSSVFPIPDLAVEHRMYLPLAAVVVFAVVAGYQVVVRFGLVRRFIIFGLLLTAVAVALGVATISRNFDYRSRVAIWQTVLQVVPYNPRARNNLGVVLMNSDTDDLTEAIRQFRLSVPLLPNAAFPHYNLGKAFELQGDVTSAIKHYRTAVHLNPDYVEVYIDLALLLKSEGRIDESIHYYQRIIELRPGNAKAHNNLGSALASQGRFDLAINHLRQSLRIDADYTMAHYNIGQALRLKGEHEQASHHFREAMRLKPKMANLLEEMGIDLSAVSESEHLKKE